MSFPLCFRLGSRFGITVSHVRVRHRCAFIIARAGKVNFCNPAKLKASKPCPAMDTDNTIMIRTKHTSETRHEQERGKVDKQYASQILDEKLTSEDSPKPKQISRKEQFKQAIKDYGVVVVVFHATITIASLGFFYILVSSGLDVVDLLRKIGIGENFLENHIAKGASTFLVAYAVHKLFVPARMALTLAATPLIVTRLRQLGFLKKVS